jgi:hypothetical protein
MRFLAGSHMSRNVRKHPEAGKFKKTNSPWQPPRVQSYPHLNLASWDPFGTFDL